MSIDRFYHASYRRPAIPVTLSLTAGIILGERLPGFIWPVLVILLATTVWLIAGLKRDRSVRWSPLLAAMAAGYLSMLPWVSPAHGPTHVSNYLDSGYWRLQGTVVDRPVVRFGRTRLVLSLETLSREDDIRTVHGRIRLTVIGATDLAPGNRINFTARLRALRNFKNPGGLRFIFVEVLIRFKNMFFFDFAKGCNEIGDCHFIRFHHRFFS